MSCLPKIGQQNGSAYDGLTQFLPDADGQLRRDAAATRDEPFFCCSKTFLRRVGSARASGTSISISIVPLIFGEALVDFDQSPHLSSWILKVKVRIRYIEYLDAEGDILLPHFFDVFGL